MSGTLVTSVKIPKSLELKLLKAVIDDGFGMKGKNRWMVQAVNEFLAIPNFYEFVDIADDMETFDAMLSIRLSADLSLAIDKAVITVRTHFPASEGVKSNIIRAAVLQKLIRRPTSVTEA